MSTPFKCPLGSHDENSEPLGYLPLEKWHLNYVRMSHVKNSILSSPSARSKPELVALKKLLNELPF